ILLGLSIVTRLGVVLLLCALALLTEYNNLKLGYNSARLVELSSGTTARTLYEAADSFFNRFDEPLQTAQTNGGMTWSIRIMGVPFTDPVAALSVLVASHRLETGFVLGLIIPLALALCFGRVFCSYICPASLLFFSIARVRRLLGKWLLFPELPAHRGFAWGILVGGLVVAAWLGHGIWSLLLPYFAIGQTIFHGIAMGTLSIALGSVVVFALLDLVFGKQFTCRYVCPTGRLLGAIGRRSVFAIRREASQCLTQCTSCADVCPFKVNPKLDETVDCSMCGECLVVCPTKCLSIGLRRGSREEAGGESMGKPGGFAGRASSFAPLIPLFLLLLFTAPLARAHHFKGLPHYNYFENYPQVPEEEFLGQAGEYELSLVVYDFQGINREKAEDPDNVRLFLLIFNLLDNRIYQGPLTLEILDRGTPVHAVKFEAADLENIYSLHRELPDTGRYSLRVTLHGEKNLQAVIPFRLSTQKIHWGKWVGLSLLILITVAAIGARKARIAQDRREARLARAAGGGGNG
ncbi:MAG: 4Fe-4S binding protein, partial [Alphaproteobacteria bacterium]